MGDILPGHAEDEDIVSSAAKAAAVTHVDRGCMRSILKVMHDGDTMSFTAVILEDSIREIERYLKSKRAYVGTNGEILHSAGIDTVNFVLASLTGE